MFIDKARKQQYMLQRGFTDMYYDNDVATASDMDSVKYINDSIHGYIKLNKHTLEFIDTPQFQRLRNLKQLGSAYHVFPGGSHNRFEHCIGTSFLANEVVQGLALRQPELAIDERDIRCVTLAGLCHDLGHGPYSHMFDSEFIPRARPGVEWSHEMGSEMMLRYAIDENNIDIDEDDVRLIKRLIHGSNSPVNDEKMFLFDIVANKHNGVDVDKFDYIQRDCYNVGVKSSYDFSRLMLNSRVIEDEVCYNHKEAYNLTEMFHTRYSLHKRVYRHRAAKAIEFMVVDAMLIADPVLNISNAVSDPAQYQLLTDDIVRDIERSREPELEEARSLIRRIHKRDLYKFVDEFILPPELTSIANRRVINEAEIVGYRSTNDDFIEHDVLVEFCCINYGMHSANPVDSVNFYSKFSLDEKFPIASDFISMCVPKKYEERIVRVFTRTASKRGQIQRAARKLIEKLNSKNSATCSPGSSPLCVTPNRGFTLPEDVSLEIKRRRLELS